MPELIGIFDGGTTVIKHNGQPHNVGVVIFRASVNEAASVDFIAHYQLVYKDSIIKNLKRLLWQKQKKEEPPWRRYNVIAAQERKAPDNDEGCRCDSEGVSDVYRRI
jgi:hypothetical protein